MCYVADDALVELEKCKARRGGTVRKEYVLPDGIHILRGYVREDDGDGKKPDGSDEDDDEDEDDEDDDDFGARGPKKQPKKKLSKKVKNTARRPTRPSIFDPRQRTLHGARDAVSSERYRRETVRCARTRRAGVGDERIAGRTARAVLHGRHPDGGCASFPNFVERFERELRPLVSRRTRTRSTRRGSDHGGVRGLRGHRDG